MATPNILSQMAASIAFQLTLQNTIANREVIAVVVSSTTWLAPFASLPNIRIVTNNNATSARMGTMESKGEGIFAEC